jgi:hypothetical protein
MNRAGSPRALTAASLHVLPAALAPCWVAITLKMTAVKPRSRERDRLAMADGCAMSEGMGSLMQEMHVETQSAGGRHHPRL